MAASTREAEHTGFVPMREAVAAGDGRLVQIYPPTEEIIRGPGYVPTRLELFARTIEPFVPGAVTSTLAGEQLAETLETMIDHTG